MHAKEMQVTHGFLLVGRVCIRETIIQSGDKNIQQVTCLMPKPLSNWHVVCSRLLLL